MSKYHDILELSPDASKDDIKKAYRKLASKHHPDKGGDEAKFKEIREAYERLTNPEKFVDEQIHVRRGNGPGGFGFHGARGDTIRDHFEEILRRHQQQQQMTIRLHFELDLESTLHDQTRTIHVPEYGIPPMEITIPAGIRHGDVMQYSNIPQMDNSVQAKNLVIQFMHLPHPDFKVVDHVHLVKMQSVDALDAIVGTTLEVKTIDGSALKIKVPAGTQNGQKLKIPQKGLKYKENTNYRGDMYVEVLIKVPTLSPSEKKVIEEINEKRIK